MRASFGHRVSLVTALLASGSAWILQAAPGAMASPSTSSAEITQRRVFSELLVPVGAKPSSEENAALSRALEVYLAKGKFNEVEPLTDFLAAHPDTAWKASLLSNLGSIYREQGYLSRAEQAWRQSWDLTKAEKDDPGRSVADWSVGNLADLLGHLGKREDLAALLHEVQGRTKVGTAGSLLFLAEEQLAAMQLDPAHTLLCGPLALRDLAVSLDQQAKLGLIYGKIAGSKGTNLAQLQTWGGEMGLDLVGICLDPKTPIPVPALLQWKAGHFATVIQEESGCYLVRNYFGGRDKWITKEVLAEELGTFALIPRAILETKAWQLVPFKLLSQVWGAGTTAGPDPDDANKEHPKCPDGECPNGMATFSFYATQVSLVVEDVPLWYTPSVGPAVSFHVYYNQLDTHQPSTFNFWNFGSKWTMDWLSYVTDYPDQPEKTTIYLRGGGISEYKGYNPTTGAFGSQYYRHDVLVRTTPNSYERRLPDGSKEVFDVVDSSSSVFRRLFLSKIIDPSGNALTFGYDSKLRLKTATDALGRATTLHYDAADELKVTQVTVPFGQIGLSATFQYDTSNQLKSITDMGGLTSGFTYGPTTDAPTVASDFLNTLITPYGRTSFAAGLNGPDRFLQATDPLGQTQRAEFHNYTGSMPDSEPKAPSGFLNGCLTFRNTFYWDKRAMASGAGDWSQAKIYHFLHSAQSAGYASPLLESVKNPLESRVWYGYGQPPASAYCEWTGSQPLTIARILDDGTEQSTHYQYNDQSKVTRSTDASGRATTYTYSLDGLDLLEVHNASGSANDLLARYTYNSQHKPLTVTDAAGQTTTFTYNTAAQVQTITNPKNETTTLIYEPSIGGNLKSITGAVAGSTTGFTYDTFGRVWTVTGPDGNTITTEYDALNRPKQVTFADGTTEAMTYDRMDLGAKKDRQGRWTFMTYNPLRRLTDVQDAGGRVTHFDWCTCGSLEQLTDPLGHITNWWRDLQGRVIGKRLDDGTQTNYEYDSAGRLLTRVDAMGQITKYRYFTDNNLKQVSYPNALKPTPGVSYTYDSSYNRLSTMVDQFGTTLYTYYPVGTTPILGAGRLATVVAPFSNSTITYFYDELGRILGRGINGINETRTFDSLGRMDTVTNPLGAFHYTYQGVTGRLDNILLPSGQKTVFSYFDATQDFRLQGISNQKSDTTVISAFNYTYNPDGSIHTWSQQADAQIPKVYSFSYDAANQLIGALLNQGGTSGALIHQYVYGYDSAGNRTSEQIDGNATEADYNDTNQLTTTRNSAITAMSKQAPVKASVSTVRPIPGANARKLAPSKKVAHAIPKQSTAGSTPSK